jgi:hypothetical protein
MPLNTSLNTVLDIYHGPIAQPNLCFIDAMSDCDAAESNTLSNQT